MPTATAARNRAAAPVAPTDLLTIDHAADRLCVSVRFMRKLVAERRIRHYKVGKFVRFSAVDLDAFVAAGLREPAKR